VRLVDLDPRFIRYQRTAAGRVSFIAVQSIAEAQGVRFLCPKCFAANGGARGTHVVICLSRSAGVPEDARPGPGRWKLEGAGYADLTLNADPPGTARSVQVSGGCNWHGFIERGEARDA